jgi:glycerol-1-phosphate dehydrogenase [NAD(P)+]
METNLPILLAQEATESLVQLCLADRRDRFLIVADGHTYWALGQRVEAGLRAQGWDVRTVLLGEEEVIADEASVFNVLRSARGEQRTYLAVGSGTITDITRYASFCSRNPFISLPTAPSVDAYASGGAALVMGGFKLTVPAQAPAAILADLPTLCEAPRELIAAGFGDMLGKYTSLADWKLGALLLDEAFDAEIAERAGRALWTCVALASEVGQASELGIETLIEGLFESGLCMMDFGGSRPASGSEHLLSHFWEIQWMQQGRPPLLHGAKVGVGTVLAARRYEAIRDLPRTAAINRLSVAQLPAREDEYQRIREGFGPVTEHIIDNYRPYRDLLQAQFQTLRHRIGERWDEIQSIARGVPTSHELSELLSQAGAPVGPHELGLSDNDVEDGLKYAPYLRGRFTVHTLGSVLNMW